jgi:dihydrodipicolinate synthase/N-acetylneuraminate lyase
MQIYDLFKAGKVKEAQDAQLELAKMEWGFGKGGINGTKWIVAKLHGYPEGSWHCRRPYPVFNDEGKQEWITGVVKPYQQVEQSLGKRGQ